MRSENLALKSNSALLLDLLLKRYDVRELVDAAAAAGVQLPLVLEPREPHYASAGTDSGSVVGLGRGSGTSASASASASGSAQGKSTLQQLTRAQSEKVLRRRGDAAVAVTSATRRKSDGDAANKADGADEQQQQSPQTLSLCGGGSTIGEWRASLLPLVCVNFGSHCRAHSVEMSLR